MAAVEDEPTTILVIDDEDTSRGFLVHMLETAGYQVQSAANGADGLVLAESAPIELILLDIILPDMDGYDVCRHLKSGAATAAIPVIFISALENVDEKVRAFKVGGVDFISKPYQQAEVLARIQTHLRLQDLTRSLAQTNADLRREIAERQEVEESLQSSEARFRNTFDLAAVGIAQLRIDGRYERVNRRFVELTGYDEAELLAMGFQDITHPDDVADDQAQVDQLHDGKLSHYTREKRYVRKDGAIIWIHLTVAVVRDTDGHPQNMISVVEDITRRVQTEENYRLLATAIEQAAESILITDRTGRILYVNPAFEALSGYQSTDVLGRTPSFLKSNHHTPSEYKELWHTIDGGSKWQGRLVNRRKDNRTYEVEGTISPIKDASGTITHFVAVQRDVTREVKMEWQLRQSQKMEAIGTLAGGIAHDFNNILSAIIGYSELSLVESDSGTPVYNNIREVLQASRRATELVKQILAFSRQTEKERKPIQIGPVIKEALRLLRSSLPVTIDIQQEIASKVGNVLADPTQVHQVIMNLCTNAAHAMDENGGVLEIRLEQIELTHPSMASVVDLSPGTHLRLTVRDTGHGMPSAVVDQIFDPYFTTKEKGEGTGLGLAVVHGIVRDHGGEVTVESMPDEGSTFTVYFPVIQTTAAEISPERPILPRGRERILFVDDEASLVQLHQRSLERLGYRVEIRTSSLEALELFRNAPERYDLVITDMTMPHLTGDRLASKLLDIQPELPIILCTGYSKRITEAEAKRIGINAFIMKPLLVEDLAHTIRQVLDARMAASSAAPPNQQSV